MDQLYSQMKETLNHQNETCYYFDETSNEWIEDSYNPLPNSCQHKSGYKKIMGHTHPIRQSIHQPIEVNYYPSAPDILFPIQNIDVKDNYIFTPFGIYIARYEQGIEIINLDYNEIYRQIDEHFFPLHALSVGLPEDTEINQIISRLNRQLINIITDLCNTIQNYLNDILSEKGYPNNFTLNYYPLKNFNGGKFNIKKKDKKKSVKKKRSKKISIKNYKKLTNKK